MSTPNSPQAQQPTPATPTPPWEHTNREWAYMPSPAYERDKGRNEGYVKGFNDALALALADHAAELAALDGVRGPVCATCGGKGHYEYRSAEDREYDRDGLEVGCTACGGSGGEGDMVKGTGHEPLVAGSVAALVRAVMDDLRIVKHVGPNADALRDALAAFSLAPERSAE